MTARKRDKKWLPVRSRRRLVGTIGVLAAMAALAACGGSDSDGPSTGDSTSGSSADAALVTEAKATLAAMTDPSDEWDGPTDGPAAQDGKSVVYVTLDGRNDGATQFGAGVEAAAAEIGWDYSEIDGRGAPDTQREAILQAVALKPDGIILGSIDSVSQKDAITQATDAGITVVGWHTAPGPGPIDDPKIFVDIQSGTSEQVGAGLADVAIADSDGTANVVIITDNSYGIAKARSEAMQARIESCSGCQVVEYLNTPIAEASNRFQGEVSAILRRFTDRPLYFLTITDYYYDFGIPALRQAGETSDSVRLVGNDGSPTAYQRITDADYEIGATVEPPRQLGWQAVDEMNRAFAGEDWSGYIVPPHLITQDNIDTDITDDGYYEPSYGYPDPYSPSCHA